jgi:RHS repeat-associated protein
VASNLPATPVTADDGSWVEVRYGEDGNALAVTVHGRCGDPDENEIELDCRTGTDDPEEAVDLSCAYSCATEQHFTYAWDEVNRIAHARRLDREDGGDWELAVEQRYLYDANNQRTVKTTTFRGAESGTERTALYVSPGDFERRGVVLGKFGLTYDAVDGDTETQYGVGGARIVWRTSDRAETLDRDQRITISLTDLIQSTTAVIDLATGELVEAGSFYANGARETYRSNETETVTPEPMGFTGKEADEEVGLTYFGHRYLMAHLGRWASPDPLQTHSAGGGETLNGYHYVSGNLLQGRDPLGLQDHSAEPADAGVSDDTGAVDDAGDTGTSPRMYDEVWVLYDPNRMDRTRSRMSSGDRDNATWWADVARRWEAQDPARRHVEYITTGSFEGVADAFERATRSLRAEGTLISDTGHGDVNGMQIVWGQPMVTRDWLHEQRPQTVATVAQFTAWLRIRDAVRDAHLSRWVLAACDVGGGDQLMRDLATYTRTRVVASTVRSPAKFDLPS